MEKGRAGVFRENFIISFAEGVFWENFVQKYPGTFSYFIRKGSANFTKKGGGGGYQLFTSKPRCLFNSGLHVLQTTI